MRGIIICILKLLGKCVKQILPLHAYCQLKDRTLSLIPINIYKQYSYRNRRNIIKYLKNDESSEKRAIRDFLINNRSASMVFPYAFALRYNPDNIEVQISPPPPRKHVLYDGKRLFFKKAWDDTAIKNYFNGLLVEQDKESPHYYLAEDECRPAEGSVIADIGAAEGIWALKFADKCEKVYLFECDEEWIGALEQTFAPWRDKVVIVNKFVGSADDGEKFITLDTFFADKRIDYIKADIEGAEEDMLKGGKTTFSNKLKGAVICAYHKQDDEQTITRYLGEYNFGKIETSDGYMIFEFDNLQPPYLRRGLVFARR
ncbi:hypothetical protein FACS1894216_05360 [Synergistales bacterium]|nr:hypothetical protein FACS1894216_05360 [Synergistales bacterium]